MASDVRTAALRLLKIRPRSILELTLKLSLKGYDKNEIDHLIVLLIKEKLLDDRAFADAWIRHRLSRPFGFVRIIRELKEKGIGTDTRVESVANAKAEYTESDVVFELTKRKVLQLKDIPEVKRNKRILDQLLRRGFSVEEAFKAIKRSRKM